MLGGGAVAQEREGTSTVLSSLGMTPMTLFLPLRSRTVRAITPISPTLPPGPQGSEDLRTVRTL